MADKHSLNYDVRELKLGASFTNNKSSQYHTIKYDFKPASVDVNKMASVDVGTNNQVTVTVPHLDGAGVPQTVFKGSQRPYTKECVLIIDRVTGEITLEKLSSNIQVKKTRQEIAQKPRPLTPVTTDFTNTTQRSSSRTRVATTKRVTNNPSTAGPPVPGAGGAGSATRYNGTHKPSAGAMVRSPPRQRTSPPQAAPWSGGGNSTLASLPMIGLDEPPQPPPQMTSHPSQHGAHAMTSHSSQHGAHAMTSHAPVTLAPMTSHAPRAPVERHAVNTHPPNTAPRDEPLPVTSHPSQHGAQAMTLHAARAPLERHAVITPPPNTAPRPQTDDSSSSSSSDSGSDSGTASDSDDNDEPARRALTNGAGSNPALPSDVLNDDLCLSESGSDSD